MVKQLSLFSILVLIAIVNPDVLHVSQQGYNYPQGKPQLAPGSFLHRLQHKLDDADAQSNFPPIYQDPIQKEFQTLVVLDAYDQNQLYESQVQPAAEMPDQQQLLADQRIPATSYEAQFDYPETTSPVQYQISAPVQSFEVSYTIPNFDAVNPTSEGHAEYAGAVPRPAATFDDINGYAYVVPRTQF